jgi:drug/metabolite transporter (DMT)-like permease
MSVPYAKTVMTGNQPRPTPPAPASADRRPVLLAAAGAACISASAVLVKLADTGAATTAFYRCLLALPVLVALAAAEQRRYGTRPLRARLQALAAGVFLAIDLVLWNHAIADVGAGIATVLGNLQVLFVAFAAWLLFDERPRRAFLIALPAVMTGVVLASGLVGGSTSGRHPVAGICYGLGTSLAYTFFLLTLRRASAGPRHAAGPLFDATAGAAAGALLIGLTFGSLQFGIGWPTFGWLLLLAISSQTLGWLLITSSLPRLPAAVSSLLLLLQPAAAIALAAVVLGQRPTIVQVCGALLVCGGVLAASLAAAPPGTVGRAKASPR